MGILKLQAEGDSHTMVIRECKEVAGNYGQQVVFSDGTDTLYLPKDSADRQLSRLGLDPAEGGYGAVVGMALTFSRDPNPKKGAKPYWGIRYVGNDPGEAPQKPSARAEALKPTPVAPSASVGLQARREAIVGQYLLLWDVVAGHLAQTSAKYGYGLDAAAIQAATATVWISWKDKGIQPDGLPEAKPEAAPQIKMPAPSGKRVPPPIDLSDFPPEPDDSDLPF